MKAVKNNNEYGIQSIYGFNAIKPIAVFLSVVCFLCLLFAEQRTQYVGVIFLPLCFFIIVAVFNTRRNINGLGGFLVYCAYMLRFTVFPLIIVLGEYRADVSSDIYEPYFNQACVIMIIECMAVFLLLTLFGKRQGRKKVKKRTLHDVSDKIEKLCGNHFLKLITVVFFVYNCFMYIRYPTLLSLYWRSIFIRSDDYIRLVALQHLISTIPGFLYYPFKLSAELLRYFITAILVVRVNKNKKTVIKNWILTIIIAFFAFSLLSSEQINSIIIGISIVYYMVLKYHRHSKRIILFGLMAFCIATIFVFVSIADVTDIGSIGRIINNYFNGPVNTAIAIHMKENHFVGLENLINDFLDAIPIIGRLTGTVSVNTFYGEIYNMQGAIIPMCGYGYYFFGYIGCWLPAALVICTVNLFDKILLQKLGAEYKIIVTVAVIHMAICVFMYTLNIYFASWIYFFIPIVIAYKIDNKQKHIKQKKYLCNVKKVYYRQI
ncbi:MAG: hypothetical protein HFE47_07160 [Clostridia bacterium]|nr:hypothetical protein [Clostridia bacterium]